MRKFGPGSEVNFQACGTVVAVLFSPEAVYLIGIPTSGYRREYRNN